MPSIITRCLALPIVALLVLTHNTTAARAQSAEERDFLRRFGFSMGEDFGNLIGMKALAANPLSDPIRAAESRVIANAKLVGLSLTLRPGRADGADRDAMAAEYRRAAVRLADVLDSRFGSMTKSAYQLGYDLLLVASAVDFSTERKQAVFAQHRQLAARSQIDTKALTPLYDRVMKSNDFNAAVLAADAAGLSTLREIDMRLIDTSAFRRLRANVFQAAFKLGTAAFAGRVDMTIAEREFERARLFADNARLEIAGFIAPRIELPRMSADGTDSAARTAMIMHYLLQEQAWVSRIGEVYGWPVADLGEAAIKMSISTLLYGNDEIGKATRGAICRALRGSGVPVGVWAGLVDNRVSYEVHKQRIFATQQAIVDFLDSGAKSDPLPFSRSSTPDDCPRKNYKSVDSKPEPRPKKKSKKKK